MTREVRVSTYLAGVILRVLFTLQHVLGAGLGEGIHQEGAGLEQIQGSYLLGRGECFRSLSSFI